MKKHLSTILLIAGAVGLLSMTVISYYTRQNQDQQNTQQTQPGDTDTANANAGGETQTDTSTPPATQPSNTDTTTLVATTQPVTTPAPANDAFNALFTNVKFKGGDLQAAILGEAVKGGEWKFVVKSTSAGASVFEVGLSDYDKIEWTKDEKGGYKRELKPFPIQESQKISMVKERNANLTLEQQLANTTLTRNRYPYAAFSLLVSPDDSQNNVKEILLFSQNWELVEQSAESVTWRLVITSANDIPLIELVRTFKIEKNSYDMDIKQTVKNLTDMPFYISLLQIGQSDVPSDYNAYMGGLQSLTIAYYDNENDPEHKSISTKEFERVARSTVISDPDYAGIWPRKKDTLEAVWVSFSSRYFAAIVHHDIPVVTGAAEGTDVYEGKPVVSIQNDYPLILRVPPNGVESSELIEETGFVLVYQTARRALKANETYQVGMGVYMGPKDPEILYASPYKEMALHEVIIYQISTCFIYTFCAFGFISEFLLMLMSWIHGITGDWSIAIIILVVLVRLALHPILRKSQMNMMKFGKRMQELAPEIDKLKKKYGDDQQKMNQEMMRLYREKGVNPIMGGLGCLPMFLQMPIWIGLYNMLATAIQLRQTPAFYGLFQNFGGWTFLEDLARQDAFLPLQPWLGPDGFIIPLVGWHLTSINILPILMAVVFMLNQKFSQAHSPAPQTDQAKQQQMMMKIMMMMFPIFLYNAPSGLTLYILTSSTIGIFESWMIRKSLKKQEEREEAAKAAPQEPAAKKIESKVKKVK